MLSGVLSVGGRTVTESLEAFSPVIRQAEAPPAAEIVPTNGALAASPEALRLQARVLRSFTAMVNHAESPLYLAAKSRKADLVEVFIEGAIKSGREHASLHGALCQAAEQHDDATADYLAKVAARMGVAHAFFGITMRDAARLGKVELLRDLLQRGAHVDHTCDKGGTAMHAAAICGHKRVLSFLINKGANVNLMSKTLSTPLFAAATAGQSEMVSRLLDAGADPNIRHPRLGVPLHGAVQAGDIASVALLLRAKAAPDMGTPRLGSPLYLAARAGRVDMVKLLCAAGATPTFGTRDGGSALHAAARYGHTGVLEFFINQKHPLDIDDTGGATPLFAAAQAGQLGALRLLVKAGADIHQAHLRGDTVLHAAARHGHLHILYEALASGADIEAAATGEGTPLAQSIIAHQTDTMRALLKAGANVDRVNEDGDSALHVALRRGFRQAAPELIARMKNVNQPGDQQDTPARLALFGCARDERHIWREAESLARADGESCGHDRQDMLASTDRICRQLKNGWGNVFEGLLRAGADLDGTAGGSSALHDFAVWGQPAVVQLLLDLGADPTRRNKFGQTALDVARTLLQTPLPGEDDTLVTARRQAVADVLERSQSEQASRT